MRYIIIAAMILAGCAWGQDIQVMPSQKKTSRDTGLEFQCESIGVMKIFKDDYVKIQGTVENTGENDFEYVKVVFTIKDESNGFIVRDEAFSDPADIGVDEIGYIDCTIDLKGKIPASVEYVVMGGKR